MSRRNKFVIIEIISTILFMISIVLIIVNGFKIFGEMLGPGKYILKINNFNRESIEEYLKKSKNRNENEELYKNGLFSVLDLCNVYSVY